MGLRQWIRTRAAQAGDADSAPAGSLVRSIIGKNEEPVHALGEYTAATYPPVLADALRRRNAVAAELRAMDLGTQAGRHENLARLAELLQTYPHPLAYEALILAYVDQRRWDEAKGVAFAARERRWEVEHSPWPEVRSEIDRLRAWSPDDVEELRREAIGELVTPGVPNRAAAAAEPAPASPGLTPALG